VGCQPKLNLILTFSLGRRRNKLSHLPIEADMVWALSPGADRAAPSWISKPISTSS
jgi:hypothetical protein